MVGKIKQERKRITHFQGQSDKRSHLIQISDLPTVSFNFVKKLTRYKTKDLVRDLEDRELRRKFKIILKRQRKGHRVLKIL